MRAAPSMPQNPKTIGWRLMAAAIPMAVLLSCAEAARAPSSGLPQTIRIPTAPGVELEVMDWGGTGDPVLVFLAGLGHSAREFDDFAPRLIDRFHVVGISRRGSGTSSDVPPDTFNDLVDDVVAVLDSLDVRRAVLVGHSFAGSEMAVFGASHAERCAGLIYLDSAYNYTDPELGRMFSATPPPQAPSMQSADSASVASVRAYYRRVAGMSPPESEIRAQNRFDANGRLLGSVPSVARGRMASMQPAPQWEAIQCPSLGIYAIPAPLDTWLPYYSELDASARERANAYLLAFSEWTRRHRAEFGRWPQNTVVEFPSSNHYFFLEKPEEAASLIREFVETL